MGTILEISRLHKSFGRKSVLKDFCSKLEEGKVYGLLGKNGEGKTTLCRMIMGVIPADSGEIRFRGKEVKFQDDEYKQCFGYIPEESIFFGWMTIGRLLQFNAAFYPSWKAEKAEQYLQRFSLDKKTRIKHLSRGMKLKLGLLLALAAEPEVLILDDPTSGLDVPTRQDFLKGIIDEILARGSTILFSSHMVHELEGLVEHLGILHQGSLLVEAEIGVIKNSVRKVRIFFEDKAPENLPLEGILTQKTNGRRAELVVYPWIESMERKIRETASCRIETESLSLEEIFVNFVAERN